MKSKVNKEKKSHDEVGVTEDGDDILDDRDCGGLVLGLIAIDEVNSHEVVLTAIGNVESVRD